MYLHVGTDDRHTNTPTYKTLSKLGITFYSCTHNAWNEQNHLNFRLLSTKSPTYVATYYAYIPVVKMSLHAEHGTLLTTLQWQQSCLWHVITGKLLRLMQTAFSLLVFLTQGVRMRAENSNNNLSQSVITGRPRWAAASPSTLIQMRLSGWTGNGREKNFIENGKP